MTNSDLLTMKFQDFERKVFEANIPIDSWRSFNKLTFTDDKGQPIYVDSFVEALWQGWLASAKYRQVNP